MFGSKPNPKTTGKASPSTTNRIAKLLVLGCCVFGIGNLAGWFSLRFRQVKAQQELCEAVTELGGQFYYDFQVQADGTLVSVDASAEKKNWIANLIGLDWGHDIYCVSLALITNRDTEHKTAIDDSILNTISQCAGVRWIALNGTQVSSLGIADLVSKLPIERLWLGQTRIDDQALVALGQCPSLTHLSLEATPTSDQGVLALKSLEKLQFLSLGSPRITSNGLRVVSKLSQLRELHIDQLPATDDTIYQLAALPDLEVLSIRRSKISNDGLRELANPKLRVLHLDGTNIGDAGLNKLGQRLPNLEEISFTQTQIGDSALFNLKSCKKLKTVRAENSACSVTGIYHLFADGLGKPVAEVWSTIADIETDEDQQPISLVISDLNFGDQDVSLLSSVPSLSTLSLRGNLLSEAGVEKLAQIEFPNLTVLNMNGSRLTDKGLVAIVEGMPRLTNLHVANTHTTIAFVNELKDKLNAEYRSLTVYTVDLEAQVK